MDDLAAVDRPSLPTNAWEEAMKNFFQFWMVSTCTHLTHVLFRYTGTSTELCLHIDAIFQLWWMRFGVVQLPALVIWIQFKHNFHQNIAALRSVIGPSPAGGNRCLRARPIRFGQTCWTNKLIEFHRTSHLYESDVIIFFGFFIRRMWNGSLYVDIDNGCIVVLSAAIVFAEPNKPRRTTAKSKWDMQSVIVSENSHDATTYTKRPVRMQCAAVRTNRSLIKEPPQPKLSSPKPDR